MLYERELAAASAKLGASRKLQVSSLLIFLTTSGFVGGEQGQIGEDPDVQLPGEPSDGPPHQAVLPQTPPGSHLATQLSPLHLTTLKILEGGEAFDELISSLQEFSRSEQLQELFDSAQSDKPS